MKPNPDVAGIGEVVAAELADIARRRLARGDAPGAEEAASDRTWQEKCLDRKLSAVAISGGGIRSATFALGVLQGLVEKGLLQKADYLSTVSGGGYIGSWLQALLYRQNSFDQLNPRKVPGPPATDPVTFLRKYSNYLAPRLGFTPDSLMIPVIWLRNTILNQAIIICAFMAVVVLACWPGFLLQHQVAAGKLWLSWLELGLAALCTGVAVWAVGRDMRKIVERVFENPSQPGSQVQDLRLGTATSAVGKLVILPLIGALTLFLFAVVSAGAAIDQVTARIVSLLVLWGLHLLLQWRGGFTLCYVDLRKPSKTGVAWLHTAWISLVCAAFLWGLLGAIGLLIDSLKPETAMGSQQTIAWAPPLYIVAVMAAVSLQIGLMGADFPDASREWLARAGSFLVIVAVSWAAVFTISTFSPLWVAQFWLANRTGIATGFGAWLMSTLASVLAGKSGKTGSAEHTKNSKESVMDLVARYGPFVAIAGFLIAVAFGVHALLYVPAANPAEPFLTGFANTYWQKLEFHDPGLALWSWIVFFAAVAVSVTLSVRVNINEFSLHHFYQNRLVRCYLGASNTKERQADPFTGFDPKDDIALTNLKCNDATPTIAPYPIVNTTLNVTAGSELATQERKALSFTFTPRYSGFVPASSEADRIATGDDDTKAFVDSAVILGEGAYLGAAMAISGAAASPCMGYHSAPQTAFLLTLFNVRLGWWAGNPRDAQTYMRPGPRFSLNWLLRELIGSVDSRSAYLSLSDGGHFENLGLYELVRRRAHYIISIDAEEDAGYQFGGLGSAVRKCRADFGVEIEIDAQRIRPQDDLSPVHCVMGRIHYPEAGSEPGWLMYLKSSLTGDEPADVQQYRSGAPAFPQQSTANQFFSESQFESYRRLGLHVAQTAFGQIAAGWTLAECFEHLARTWGSPTKVSGA